MTNDFILSVKLTNKFVIKELENTPDASGHMAATPGVYCYSFSYVNRNF